jgi:hypothetical protein
MDCFFKAVLKGVVVAAGTAVGGPVGGVIAAALVKCCDGGSDSSDCADVDA